MTNDICLDLLRQCEAEGNYAGSLKLASVISYLNKRTISPRNDFERMFCACLSNHPVLIGGGL